MIQDMLFTQKDINWNDLPTYQKRGSCCIKKEFDSERTHWVIDKDIPKFSVEPDFINKHIIFNEK